ncbi:hypothetical protein ACIQB5_24465 [Streptomyces sp. NPDC088560]|uniref:hypothetical protein n=1 Tax=Streptomyces sp. NPDC088560 TaxID=3365868 RepID=UPI00381FAAA7
MSLAAFAVRPTVLDEPDFGTKPLCEEAVAERVVVEEAVVPQDGGDLAGAGRAAPSIYRAIRDGRPDEAA